MLKFIRAHLPASIVVAVVSIAALAWLAFGWFGIHTAFIDRHVDEALPEFDATPATPTNSATQTQPAGRATADATPTTEVYANEDAGPRPDSDNASYDANAGPRAADTTTTTEPTGATPTIMVEADGEFSSIGRYTTEGAALVLGNGTDQRFLRFERFSTNNGPDLNVYLVNSATGDVSDYVDLGDLKGNIGDQNYEIPRDVDLDVYDTVMIWCVRFSTGFGQAALTTA